MKKTRKLFMSVTFLVIAAMMLTGTAFAAGEATVNSYMLNMREGAGTEYTIIDVAYQGNTVQITQDDGSGWVQVSFHGMTGYMNKLFLDIKDDVPAVTETYTAPVQAAVEAAPVQVAANPNANATILGDGVNLRTGPSMVSSVITTLSTGTPIQVCGSCGAWYEVAYNNQIGYIYGDFVVMNGNTVTYTVTMATAVEQAPVYTEPLSPDTMNPVAETTAVEIAPAPQTPVQTVTVEPQQETAPAAEPTPEPTPEPAATPAPAVTTATNPNGQAIANTAMQYIGVPYVWAGTSPETGFDCSGLVYYVYGQYGISLNRVAQSMYYNGEAVDLNALQPGDILLFGSSVYNIWHAGLYIGNGQFIHAAGSGSNVRTQSLDNTYGMRLVAARRVV